MILGHTGKHACTQWVDRRLGPLHQDKPSSIGKPGGVYPHPCCWCRHSDEERWVALLDTGEGATAVLRLARSLAATTSAPLLLVTPVLADLPEEKRPPLHSFLMQPDLGDLFTMLRGARTHRLILAADSPFCWARPAHG